MLKQPEREKKNTFRCLNDNHSSKQIIKRLFVYLNIHAKWEIFPGVKCYFQKIRNSKRSARKKMGKGFLNRLIIMREMANSKF